MPQALVNGIDLYYEEHGQPSGVPLVLVHGYSGVGAIWEPFLPAYTGRYRVIVPDLRAHGASSGELETIHHRTFGLDLVALLDHLHIDRAHFIGHSSGGMSLLFIGQEAPHRVITMTLANATYIFDGHAQTYMRSIMAELPTQPEALEESRRRHGAAHDENHWQVLREAYLAFTNNPAELPFRPEDLAGIDVPTLILHGDRDEFFPVYIPVTMYTSLPHAELCILPRAGHDAPVRYPQIFLHLTNEFMDRHAETEPTP